MFIEREGYNDPEEMELGQILYAAHVSPKVPRIEHVGRYDLALEVGRLLF